MNKSANERTNEQMNERTNERTTLGAVLSEDPDHDLGSKITRIMVHQRNGFLVRGISYHDSGYEIAARVQIRAV